MSLEAFENSISKLSKYYNLPDRDKLLEALSETQNIDTSIEGQISRVILRSIDGGYSSSEIINKLNDFASEASSDELKQMNKIIKIFSMNEDALIFSDPEPTSLSSILKRESSKQETKAFTNISVICLRHAKITPASRDVNAIPLFFNSIPTIEFSRAVPFLNVSVQTSRPSVSSDGRLNTLSQMKFLLGAEKVDKGTNLSMAKAISPGGAQESISGMELFTSPQTLVNANLSNDPSVRVAPVLDIFRPFMSIEKLKIRVHQGGGQMISFKNAELSIVLHDRSRLSEISELLAPSLYGQTEILLEYGWSHPDNSEDNVYGQLLNSLRLKEKYGVKNYTMVFDDAGQAKINLKLFIKGGTDVYTTKITEGEDGIVNSQKTILELQDAINEIKGRLSQNETQKAKEIRQLTILDMPSDLSSVPNIKKIQKEMRILRAKIRGSSSKDGKELFEKLEELYGEDKGETQKLGGKFGDLKRRISDALKRKLNIISSEKSKQEGVSTKEKVEENLDPFISLDEEDTTHLSGKFVSLGKLFLTFVADPLASTGRFDDVQLIFYNFNSSAGNASQKNISEFLVDVRDFKEKIQKIIFQRRTGELAIWEFKQFIVNQYIDNPGNFNFGFSDRFNFEKDKLTGERIATLKGKSKDKEGNSISVNKENLLNGLKIGDKMFKIPILDVNIEAVPSIPVLEGETIEEKEGKTILKIHIFDKQNSPFETQVQLLKASRDNVLDTFKNEINSTEDKNHHSEVFNKIKSFAEDKGIIEMYGGVDSDKGEDVFQIRGGPEALKSFLYETTPYIIYGAQNTAIEQLGFSTIYDSLLTTINLQRAGESGDLRPSGVEKGNVPMQMFPAQLNVKCLGCPILHFGQQFFVDVQTNTSCDNVYGVVELNHEISAGKFESQIRMVPMDAYGTYRSTIQAIGVALKKLDSKSEEE